MRNLPLAIVLCGASSTLAFSSARGQFVSRWSLAGELGFARVENRQGLAITSSPTWQWHRFTVSNTFEAVFGGLTTRVFSTNGGIENCGSPNDMDARNRRPCPGRSWVMMGDVADVTAAFRRDTSAAIGVGYRMGAGRGMVGSVKFSLPVRKGQALFVRSHIGAHYIAIRVGARLFP